MRGSGYVRVLMSSEQLPWQTSLFSPHILEVGVADEYIQTPNYKYGHEA